MLEVTLSREQCREVDRRAVEEYGVPSIVLMENAGRGMADFIRSLEPDGPVVICCGRGNNAGDGFVIARHLDLRVAPLKVLVWADADHLPADAATNLRIIRHAGLPVEMWTKEFDEQELKRALDDASLIVDALLGTGARGAPRAPFDRIIECINDAAAPTIAVDVPSGMDCDTGETPGAAIHAAHTCTFVAEKPGFHAAGAEQFTGQVHVLDIGAPRQLIAEIAGI